MPMGAVIFVDFWLIRKFGLQSSYAEKSGRLFNWAAGAAWLVTLTVAMVLVNFSWIVDKLVAWNIIATSNRVQWLKETFTIQIYFVSLPGWFVAAILYVVLSKFYQTKIRPDAAQA
jgi:hypothetical protein